MHDLSIKTLNSQVVEIKDFETGMDMNDAHADEGATLKFRNCTTVHLTFRRMGLSGFFF